MTIFNKKFFKNIPKKMLILTIIMLIIAIIMLPQGIDWIKNKISEKIVFKTINIEEYGELILPDGQKFPIIDEIEFTITNRKSYNLVIDDIYARLINYREIPKYYQAKLLFAARLEEVEYSIDFSPEKKIYNISEGERFEIEKGHTGIKFSINLSSDKYGIYEFEIILDCRLGGTQKVTVYSDKKYIFVSAEGLSRKKNH